MMSDILFQQDKSFVFAVVAGSAALVAVVSYVIFGPEAWRGRGSKCMGLINLGNTCFINAIIQALSSLPMVNQWLHQCSSQCKGKLTAGMNQLLHDLNSGDQLEVSPRPVIDGLLWHGWILDNQQQDALELYNILLSTIEEELAGAQSSIATLQGLLKMEDVSVAFRNSSVLTKIGPTMSPKRLPQSPLRGLLVSSLVCCKCRRSLPAKYEHFDSLSLPINNNFSRQVISLETCLGNYMSSEIVTSVECTHCSKTSLRNEKRNFTKTMLIGRAPKCLGIHLLRTMWLSDGSISKNHTHLKFPLSFDISQFMDCSDKSSHHFYRLQAVVEHIGGPHSGHYCTYRRHSNHWVYTSDSSVHVVAIQEVLQCQAYMLFYERVHV